MFGIKAVPPYARFVLQRTFDCAGGGLGPGAVSLVCALLDHPRCRVRAASFDANPALGDAGCLALLAALARSPTLESLSLCGCGASAASAKALVGLAASKPGACARLSRGNDLGSWRRVVEECEARAEFDGRGDLAAPSGGDPARVGSLATVRSSVPLPQAPISDQGARPSRARAFLEARPSQTAAGTVAAQSRKVRLHIVGDSLCGKVGCSILACSELTIL